MRLTLLFIFPLLKNGYSASFPSIPFIVPVAEYIGDNYNYFASKLPNSVTKIVHPVIAEICTTLQKTNSSPPAELNPNINDIKFILITSSGNFTVPIMDVNRLWNDSLFNQDWPTAIYINGYTINLAEMPSVGINMMAAAYLNRTRVNFIALDPSYYIDTLIYWTTYNAMIIGKYVGEALALLDGLYATTKIHVIGHSLGGQIAGAVGRGYTSKTGKLLYRITGLEPGEVCFRKQDKFLSLNKNDASFVDIVHTTNGVPGIRNPIGHVDFYANGDSELQPGCKNIACSHLQSRSLFIETVYQRHEYDLIGIQCKNYTEMVKKNCFGKQVAMGYITPSDSRGIYYLKTKSSFPNGEI